MDAEAYRRWLRVARRFARAEAAEDLLHDGLLTAARAGRIGLASEEDQRWFAGVLRRHGAFLARSAIRRRRREHAFALPPGDDAEPALAEALPGCLARLPRGTRLVAQLALHGCSREEITLALGLRPEAFRQRLTALRRALDALPADQRDAVRDVARAATAPRDLGQLRRALLRALAVRPGIGICDPDGHLIILADLRLDPTSRRDRPRQLQGEPTEES